jgi:hypothetical protein
MHRDQLRIAEPCHADWAAMTGDQRKRFCGSCTKHVHDLSALTERQAERLVTSEAELCVRYAADADGRVLHARSRLPRIVAVGAALLWAAPALASSAPATTAEPGLVERLVSRVQQAVDAVWAPAPAVTQGQVMVMGDIGIPTPPPPPEPEVTMGKIAAPPTIRLEPAPVVLPTPAPGETVIPEVEEALRRQR